jgi:hypothetical protein
MLEPVVVGRYHGGSMGRGDGDPRGVPMNFLSNPT